MQRVIAVKTNAGEWTLDVLGVPFGGPHNGRDRHGEFFSANTKFHADRYGLPPVVYYHGFDDKQRMSNEPNYIGKTISREVKRDGVWFRVVLDKASDFARRVWEAAKKGAAAASSGSIEHLYRINKATGEILEWPTVELSLFETNRGKEPANSYAVALPAMKALYAAAGLDLPLDIEPEPEADPTSDPTGEQNGDAAQPDPELDEDQNRGGGDMDPKELQKAVDAAVGEAVGDAVGKAVKAALDEQAQAREVADKAEQEQQETIDAAVKAAVEAKEKEWAEQNRLPGGGAPYATKFANTAKYDDVETGDLAVMYGILHEANRKGMGEFGPTASENVMKALAVRMAEDTDPAYVRTRKAMKMAGMPLKANELNQSTLANYGDEWVGVTYSTQLWESIRQDTPVVGRIPTMTVPQGSESVVIPLEGTPPTFYTVAQASAQDSNPGDITKTVTTSKLGTGQKTLTVGKLGAATAWTGELNEDSLIPWISEVRGSIQREASEVLEHVVIDGDTETGATANINDIGGTPAGREAFLLFDGFRKSCLVTTTTNSRDGGAFALTDYLETLKLMGLGGRNALARDRSMVAFIQDLATGWKSLELAEVKTRDVFSQPTIESGQLVNIYGRDVITTPNMHRANQDATYGLKANSSGMVDLSTAANNTKGAILSVRFDQWRLGWKRMITFETQRVPLADASYIVAMLRVGMVQRDTEASAISYNLTV